MDIKISVTDKNIPMGNGSEWTTPDGTDMVDSGYSPSGNLIVFHFQAAGKTYYINLIDLFMAVCEHHNQVNGNG